MSQMCVHVCILCEMRHALQHAKSQADAGSHPRPGHVIVCRSPSIRGPNLLFRGVA